MLPLRAKPTEQAAAEPGVPASGAKPAPAPDGRAKRIKDAAEAASAVAKAALFFGAIAIVGAVIATTLWRDRHARHVEVSIDAEAEKTLRAIGSQLDLRQTFVDVLNARIRGVEQIFALDFAQLVDTRDAPDVSFKPFGLDASTGQITKIARELTGAPPPTTVRIELLCPKAKCDDAGAPGSTLLVTVVDRDGSERLAIPIGGSADGLPRRLREAMRRSADLLLERAEPLIAAVYYLNIAQQRIFLDDVSRDMQRSMKSALKLRDGKGETSCVANLIIGGALLKRGIWQDGLAIEQRAGLAGDAVCEVHAATNIAFFVFPFICADDPALRESMIQSASQALAKLSVLSRFGMSDIVTDRIPSAEFALADMRFLDEPGSGPSRLAFCRNERLAAGDPATVEQHVATSLDRISRTLPPRANQRGAQALIEQAATLERLAISQDAIAARYRTSLTLMRMIDAYLPTDATPRRLFALRGHVATEMAAAAKDALALDDGARRRILQEMGIDAGDPRSDSTRFFREVLQNRLLEARADFQNALAASGSAAIGEAAIDVDLGTRLGDASLLLDDLAGARDGYARAIDAFLAAESPGDQLIPLAETMARLATLDQRIGVCSRDAAKADFAQSPVARLGISLADWCSLGDAATSAKPGLVGIIAGLVKPSIDACNRFLVRSDEPYPAFRWVRCARDNGPGSYGVLRTFLNGRNGAALRSTIDDALRGSGSGGT